MMTINTKNYLKPVIMSKAQLNFFQWILSHAKEKLSKYQFKVSHNLLIKNKFCRWSSSLPDKTVQDEEGWDSTCRPALEGLLIMAQYILVLVLIMLLLSVYGWRTKRILKAFFSCTEPFHYYYFHYLTDYLAQ